jgi:hypothetical protein
MRTFTQVELRLRRWTRAAIRHLPTVESADVCGQDFGPIDNPTPTYSESDVLAVETHGKHRITVRKGVSSLAKALIDAMKVESLNGLRTSFSTNGTNWR